MAANWWESDPVVEQKTPEQNNWWENDPVVESPSPTKEVATLQEPSTILQQYSDVAKRYKTGSDALSQAAGKYNELSSLEQLTPEQNIELTNSWQSMLESQAGLSKDAIELKRLQPQYEQYFADQEKARYDATEELRLNPALEGIVDKLHELDDQHKKQLQSIQESDNTDEIKQKNAEEITSSIQKNKKDLIDAELNRSRGVENTINSVAEALREKDAAMEKRKTDILIGTGATMATAGLGLPFVKSAVDKKDEIEAQSKNKIDSILANVPEDLRQSYTIQAEQVNKLVTGDTKSAVINNELRISPTILFNDDEIKSAIDGSYASELQKNALRKNIPQMQQNLAKQEIPIFNQLSEFQDFIKENKLENSSDVEKIKAYKNFDGNWFGKLGAQAKLGIQRGYANSIGQVQVLFGTAADLVARGTGSETARSISNAFMGASMDQADEVEQLTRMSQSVGGPQIVADIAQVGTEIAPVLASGGMVGIGAKSLATLGVRALTPAVVSELGFATSVGAAGLQSYAGVYSDATKTLRDRFVQNGMGEDKAMDLAMRQAYLPAVLAGITTAALTAAGGKTGVEAVFNIGKDAAFKGTVRNFFKDISEHVVMEGLVEEGPDQFIQGIIAQATYNPDMSLRQIIEETAKASMLGGLFGGTVGAATYGIETSQARKAITARQPITAFNTLRINALEGDLKNLQTASPLGSTQVGPIDMFNPSQRAAGFGAKPMEKTKLDEIEIRRAQLSKMLSDEKLSSITQNDIESELAKADYEYVQLLAQGRNNLLTEQILDKIAELPAESADAMRGVLKIANNMGAESLTGRERFVLGITKSGNRFVPSIESPLIKTEADGTFSVTDAGKRAVEANNLTSLSRMIGISEGLKAQLEEQNRVEEALREEEAKREARRTAESDDAKRYGPQSAEALKNQVNDIPNKPENEQAKVRLAELLRQQEEEKRKAVEGLQKKVAPTAPLIEQAQARVAEREGQAATTTESPTGTRVEAAAYQAPDGTVYYGASHLDAMAKARDAGKIDQATIDAKQETTSRETPEFGFSTDKEAFVSRDQAEAIARQSGQITVEQPATGKLHSNEVQLDAFMEAAKPEAVVPKKAITTDPLLRFVKAEQTPEDIVTLTDAGLIEVYKDQPVLTQAGIDALPEADRPRLTPEARKIQIDTGASEVVAEAISKGLRIGVDQVGPNVTMPDGWTLEGDIYIPPAPVAEPPVKPTQVTPTAGVLTEDDANKIIETAQKERESKPPVKKAETGALAPKDIIGKKARQALLTASRLNLSAIANKSPNEIMMQDVAAILAELNAPILDTEDVVSLASVGYRGRARRMRLADGRTVIAMPSAIRSDMETLVHEVGHTITADMIAKYAPRRKTGRGQNYRVALEKAIADANTPEPVKRLFSLYVSTLDQLGITEQFIGAGGVAGTPDPDTSVSLAQRRQGTGVLRKDLSKTQLYGLANVEEFVSQTFSEPDFRELLKTLKDPTTPKQTLWKAFVQAIQKILQLPKESMAAAVVEASIDVGMITKPSKVKGKKAQPTPAPQAITIVDDAFSVDAFKGKEGFKSRSKIVKMSIDDFLKIATPLPKEQSQEAQKAFDSGIKWESIPFLSISTNTEGIAKVLGHEGRHRALVLKRAGFTEMPVEIRDRNIRWSEQSDPESFDYSEVFPTQLEAEKTDTKIPFPFTRDQSTELYSATEGEAAPPADITEEETQYNDAIVNKNETLAQKIVDKVASVKKYISQNLLFHGTTHIFNVFTKDRANIENDFGKGYYLTNSEADAQINYAGEGPDLTNRIERLSEQLQDNENLDEAEARKKATEILSGGGQRIMRVYVRLENPFNVGGKNETFLDYELPYDETTEEYGEPTGKLAEFLDALRLIIESYAENSPVDADKAIGNIVEYALDRGGISASDLVRLLKQEDSGIMWASDENGDSATSEIIRQSIEDSGFDGIVDSLVNEKFGDAKKIGKQMAGMGPDTVHTIVFNSSQIKSADAFTYDDQGNVIPLSQRFLPEEEDVRYAPEEEFKIIPEQVEDQVEGSSNAETIKIMGEAFKLANEQSAAAGTAEGTIPLETITSAWMNSGKDISALENAIIRYTNLEPEVASTLAQSIAKQAEIQRGIMEVSNMAKSRKAEQEATPEEKPYSFAERVKQELPAAVRSKINTVYEVLRNDVSVQEANEVMRGLSLDEAITATKDMNNGVSLPVRSMMAQIVNRRLMDFRKNSKKSGNKAEYSAAVDAHVDFFNWTNEYFKELGQGVQAIARFFDLGADGILRKLKRDTDKVISKGIKERKVKIDQIKKDIEDGDSKAFDAAVKANKINAGKSIDSAAQEEAKKLSIEEQAQKLAQRAAQKVKGEEIRRRKPDPLSELVNGHLRRYNANFVAEATAMGVSQATAQAIEDSAKKLRDSRIAAKTEQERFNAMQDERMKVKKQLARENKYIYGDRPTIWEDYQQMFSERLARRLMRDPKKKIPPSLLLFTDRLTENLLGFIPETERQATTQQSFQSMIEDALNNKEKYQQAFNQALEDISLKVMELEARAGGGEAVASDVYKRALAAQDFMQNLAPMIQDFPVSEKLIGRFVNQKTRQLDISLVGEYNRWYRASRRDRGEIEARLQERLIADLNIPITDAQKLSKSIIKDFREKADQRREKALERFKAPKEKSSPVKQTPLKKFFELTNMGALTDQDAYEIMANRFDLPTWDEKFANRVYEMAQDIQDMDDGLERRLMTQNLMVEIARQKGFNLADLGSGFIYANILSSPDTHMVNIVDTLINNFANAFADAVSTKDFSRLRGVVKGYGKGIFEAMEVMKTGRRINMPSFEEKAPLIAELVRFGRKGGVKLASKEGANAVAQSILESKPAKFLNAAKWIGRLLEAQDALNFAASVEGQRYAEAARIATEEGFKGKEKQKRLHEILNVGDGAYQKALQQAQSEGYSGTEAKFRAIEIQDEKIPSDIKERSFERGLRDVYRNMPVGVAGQLAATVNNTFEKIDNPWVRNALKLTVSPFIITPINLFNKWLDWSPWGYKRLFLGTGGWYGVDSKYYVAPYAKGTPEWRAQMFKANSSVVVMGLIGGLIKAGIMTLQGRGPSDEEERKQWLADGNKPYTFRFGNGPQISFVYSPWAVPLSVMANMVNWNKYNAKDDASYAYRLMASVSFIPAIVMELPFFQGAADLIDLVNMKSNADMSKRFEKFAEGKVAMLFPNFLRYVDRLFDPTQYDSQGLKGIIIDQMPFARRLGGPKLNMFGEPIGEGKPLIDRLIGRFAAFPKPSRESRILAKYDTYPYMPNPRRAEALIDGEKAPMTEEQYSKFAEGVGQEFKKWLNDNYDPDAEVNEQDLERGKKRISDRLSKIRARWVREVSTY